MSARSMYAKQDAKEETGIAAAGTGSTLTLSAEQLSNAGRIVGNDVM